MALQWEKIITFTVTVTDFIFRLHNLRSAKAWWSLTLPDLLNTNWAGDWGVVYYAIY